MKKAIYIHRAPDGKSLVNILMEPWPEGGITDREAQEEATALKLWLGEYLPGHVYDIVIDKESLKETEEELLLRRRQLSELRAACMDLFKSLIDKEREGLSQETRARLRDLGNVLKEIYGVKEQE